MLYVSTRGEAKPQPFTGILLEGLAPDGGLFLPEEFPKLAPAELSAMRRMSYAELAFAILSKFADDIPAGDLKRLAAATYTKKIFGSEDITPVRKLEPDLYLLGLSNGPSLAFKDLALQLLGNLFEYALAKRGEPLNILGATSGDTGSSAEYALRGKKNIRVFMLSPHGRMSPFQAAQMYSLQDANIFNIAIEGVFDDCQDIVKAVSNDLAFKRRHKIGSVNSINWARLLAQVVYYFAGYFQATQSSAERVSFAVPSGNFGNICAGHVARMMGLPIKRLVLASNENRVLDEFFRTGIYRVRSSTETFETSSPSMDISKASNFERFVFDLLGRDGERTAALFKTQVEQQGFFELGADEFKRVAGYGFVSGHSTHADRIATIRDTYQRSGVMIETHTADGLKVAREHMQADVPMIVLETALPAKFAEAIVEALGREPERPAAMQGIENLPKRVKTLPADADAVKRYISEHA